MYIRMYALRVCVYPFTYIMYMCISKYYKTYTILILCFFFFFYLILHNRISVFFIEAFYISRIIGRANDSCVKGEPKFNLRILLCKQQSCRF